jgi:hypothetical protein
MGLEAEMHLEGTIQGRDLADVVLVIGRENRTGILTVQGEQEIIGISFQDGEIVSADALNQTVEEGLGEVLENRELVRPEDLAALAAEHQVGGGRVMDLLVERNHLSREELLDALRYHTYRLCRQVLQWRSGEYKFYSGEEVSFEEGVAAISVEELLVHSAQDLGSQGPLAGRIPELGTVYRSHDGVAAEGPPFGQSLPADLLQDLENEAGRIHEFVDGQRSADEIVAQCGMPQAKALMALYRLDRAGRIEPVAKKSPASLPGPVPAAPVAPLAPPPAEQKSDIRPQKKPKKKKPKRRQPRPSRGRPERTITGAQMVLWTSRLLAAGLAAALVGLLGSEPSRLLLPFPWQGSLRQILVEQQRSAGYIKVDRAAKTFFLLEGRFPESLSELVDQRLLNPEDLIDPGGATLGYSAFAASYQIRLQEDREISSGGSRVETITGDFLLDPEFVVPELAALPPLVLLD